MIRRLICCAVVVVLSGCTSEQDTPAAADSPAPAAEPAVATPAPAPAPPVEPEPAPPAKPPFPEPRVYPPPRDVDGPDIICDRVRLRPLEVTVQRSGRPVKMSETRWRGRGGSTGCLGMTPAWPGIDVLYGRGALLYLESDQHAHEVIAREDLSIASVVFDGTYVWAANGYDQGIVVIDRAGGTVAEVTPAQGLPVAGVEISMHALAPGKVIVGSTTEDRWHGWLATVTLGDGQPQVNVFHQSTSGFTSDLSTATLMDPSIGFQPEWIIEHWDKTRTRWLLVQRRQSPLVIDAEELTVSVCGLNGKFTSFPRQDPPASAFLSYHGTMYIAGSNSDYRVLEMDPATKVFRETEARKSTRAWHSGNRRSGGVAIHEGHLIFTSEFRWLRRNIATGVDTVLLADRMLLPDHGSGEAWVPLVSASFGLVVWHGAKLYQLRFQQG